ncbi:MAG: mandelate racemase/muconate lactonizing enzyme family protein [Alphaproteobacteria bacterium]
MAQPFRDGPYVVSGGRVADGFDSTIVAVEADDERVGWGEMAPLGAFYDPAFAAGARAAIAELAPALIGEDPLQAGRLNWRMDVLLKGHPYAKSALDMACWDLAGKAAGRGLCELLGGRYGRGTALYRSISQGAPEAMARRALAYRDQGYRRLQVKVGGEPEEDVERLAAVAAAVGGDVTLFADANGGWTVEQARRFLRLTRAFAYTLEQPCASYDECRRLRGQCDRPLVLDESLDDLGVLVRAATEGTADGVTLKIARIGGVTKTRLLRDVAVGLGLAVTVEDTGGAEIDTAAMAHLSISTPEPFRLHTVDFHNWVTVSNATPAPVCADGLLLPPDGPGLGVVALDAALGPPFHESG